RAGSETAASSQTTVKGKGKWGVTMANISDISWTDFEQIKQTTDMAIIPVGAVEVYGPHMPQGTDGIVASALAEHVAEAVGCFVTPLIPIGYSQSLTSFPGTLTVSPEALKAYLRDLAESLIRWDVRRLFFVNGHLGNVPIIVQLAEELEAKHRVRVAHIDLWRFIQPLSKDLLESEAYPFGHDGEAMTSVVMYLRPDLVHEDRLCKTIPAEPVPFPEVLRPVPYRRRTDTGVLGDATLATAEKGEEIFRRAADALIRFLTSSEFQLEDR